MRRTDAEHVLRQLGAYKFVSTSGGFMTNCPLGGRHKNGVDRTPSMKIFDGDPSFCKCFGCQYGGKLFFLAKECGAGTDLLSFIDGAEGRDVVSRAKNIKDYDSIPNVARYGGRSAVDRFEKASTSRIFKDNGWFSYDPEVADEFSFDSSKVDQWLSAPFPKYLDNRGLTEETYRLWKLGNDENGFLVKKEKEGRIYYVNFGPRVVFCVYSEEMKLVGWSGRTIFEAEMQPLYFKNENEENVALLRGTPRYYHAQGFRKNRYLYGMHMVDKNNRTAIIVEGFMDALMTYQNGYKNCLAMMCSSLSDEQVEYIVQRFDRVALLPDGDTPGVEGMKKSFEKLSGRVTVKVCRFLDEKDPGDYSREELKKCLSEVYIGARKLDDGIIDEKFAYRYVHK